jgi:hypothetical protein
MSDKHCQECGCTRWIPVDLGPQAPDEQVYQCVCCDALLAEMGYRIYPKQFSK